MKNNTQKLLRRLATLAMALVMILTLLPAGILQVSAATGTVDDPVLVTNANIRTTLEGKLLTTASTHYKLTEDIDLSGQDWTPISNFGGTLDGNGYKITGLQIGTSTAPSSIQYAGFIRHLTGTVKNLAIEVEIYATYTNESYFGGVAARMAGGTIDNCSVSGKIVASTSNKNLYAGGIVGYIQTGTVTIKNCTNYAAIEADSDYTDASTKHNTAVGGIVGQSSANGAAAIQNCANYGTLGLADGIKDRNYIGGIVARDQSSKATVTNSYNGNSVAALNNTNVTYQDEICGSETISLGTYTGCYYIGTDGKNHSNTDSTEVTDILAILNANTATIGGQTWTMSANGPVPYIYVRYSLQCNAVLCVKFYAPVGSYMMIAVGAEEPVKITPAEVDQPAIAGYAEYRIDVLAQDMLKPISARLYDENGNWLGSQTFRLSTYVDQIDAGSYSAKDKAVANAAETYCTYVAKAKGNYDGTLENLSITADLTGFSFSESGTAAEDIGVYAYLDSGCDLRLAMPAGYADGGYTVIVDNIPLTPTVLDVNGTNYWVCGAAGLVAENYGKDHTFVVKNSEGQEVYSATVSVLGYIREAIEAAEQNDKNIMAAMYAYYAAAVES